jgi:hypothetical protein
LDPSAATKTRACFELVTHLELPLRFVWIISSVDSNLLLIDVAVHAPLTQIRMVVRKAVQTVLLVAQLTVEMPVELVSESSWTSSGWTPGNLRVQKMILGLNFDWFLFGFGLCFLV